MISKTQKNITIGLLVVAAAVIIGIPTFVTVKDIASKSERALIEKHCPKTDLMYRTRYGMQHVYDCTGVDIKI